MRCREVVTCLRVYCALSTFADNFNSLPFTLIDFVPEVDINDVADGEISCGPMQRG